MLRRLTVSALLLLAMLPANASAQSRLSLEVHVAPVVPLGRLVDTLAVRSEQIDGRGTPGLSSLVDRRGAVGVRLGLRVVSGVLEAGYAFAYLPFGATREICRGTEPVTTLPDGTIEDAAVAYSCVARRDAPVVTLLDDRAGLQIHAVDGGLRLVATGERTRRGRIERASGETVAALDRVRVYAAFAAGPRLATASGAASERSLRAGIGLTAGGGVEARIAPRITLLTEARYGMDLLMTSSSPSRNADRAVAAGRGVLGALTDTFHTLHVTLGARLDLR